MGNVIPLNDGVNPSRGEAILNQFGPINFGTFGGRLMRILYVGLAPTILMVTGVGMWWYRLKQKGKAASAKSVTSH